LVEEASIKLEFSKISSDFSAPIPGAVVVTFLPGNLLIFGEAVGKYYTEREGFENRAFFAHLIWFLLY